MAVYTAKLTRKGATLKPNEELLSRGFGTKIGGKLVLSSTETMYLVEKDILAVTYRGRRLDFRELTDFFIRRDSQLMSRYLIYRDLRERGYVVKDGYGLGIDFLVYDKGTYGEKPAKMLVIGVNEGEPIPVRQLARAVEVAVSAKKELKVAVLDRRGEVIYYSLSKFAVERR